MPRKPQIFPIEKLTKAEEMRAGGASWNEIAFQLRVSKYKLFCALKPGYRDNMREKNLDRVRARRAGTPRIRTINPESQFAKIYGDTSVSGSVGYVPKVAIPPEVLADRDRRMALPTPTFGDPPPGYSALDKSKGRAA